MQIILLERIEKLGFIGDVVSVKPGYARNFLLPKSKALRANEANLEYFKTKKAEIEATNLKLKTEAEKIATKLDGIFIELVRQASESGFLFGSVRPADIVSELANQGYTILRTQVKIPVPIKSVGNHKIGVQLHPEVISYISLRVMTAQEKGNYNEEEIMNEDILPAID